MGSPIKFSLLYKAGRVDVLLYKILEKIGIKNAFVPYYPYTLMIEPTNACNLHCPTCPTGAGKMNRPKRMMNFEEFKGIIDQAKGRVIKIILFNYGEPFLNNEILKMIKYATSVGMWVVTSTNGQFFTSKEFCFEVISSGLQHLIIAIDGADQETIAKFKRGVQFSKIINGFSFIIEAKKQLRSKTPIIQLQFIMMKHNEHQRNYIKQLTKQLGFDIYCEKSVWIDCNDPEFQEMAKEYLPNDLTNSRYYLRSDGRFALKGEVINNCSLVDLNTVINSDGTVVPCCYDLYSDYIMGNIFEESLKAIWNNEKYNAFRKQIKKDRKSIPICNTCSQFRYVIRKQSFLK